MTPPAKLLLCFVCIPLALAFPPPQHPLTTNPESEASLPVVFWHGLGDTYNGKGLDKIAAIINATYPRTFIHSIYVDKDPGQDRNAGFLGNVPDQVPRPSVPDSSRLDRIGL